jgi:hypothetical protein
MTIYICASSSKDMTCMHCYLCYVHTLWREYYCRVHNVTTSVRSEHHTGSYQARLGTGYIRMIAPSYSMATTQSNELNEGDFFAKAFLFFQVAPSWCLLFLNCAKLLNVLFCPLWSTTLETENLAFLSVQYCCCKSVIGIRIFTQPALHCFTIYSMVFIWNIFLRVYLQYT